MSYRGLFYETLDSQSNHYIKTATVYFDKVYILTPVTLIRDVTKYDQMQAAKKSLLEDLSKHIDLQIPEIDLEADPEVISTLTLQEEVINLVKEDIVSIVNPFDGESGLNVKDELVKIAREAPAKLGALRLGSCHSAAVASTRGAMFHSEAYGDDFHSFFCDDTFRRQSINKTHGPKYTTEHIVKMDGAVLRKIMLRSAVLVSAVHKAYPISTDEYINSKLMKYHTSGINGHTPESIANLQKILNDRRHVTAYKILGEVIAEALPDFSALDFDDILTIRNKFNDELVALRCFLEKLALTVQHHDDEDSIAEDVKNIVVKDVNPAIIDLKRRIKTAKQKLPHRMLDRLALTTSSTLVATAVTNYPVWYSPLIVSGILSAVALSETYREIVDIKANNSLSFILRLRK